MLKTTSVIIAVLLSSAAYADNKDGSIVTRGTSQAYTDVNGVPYITPFVSDRTHKPIRNFQHGPFHELGREDKVEWRR